MNMFIEFLGNENIHLKDEIKNIVSDIHICEYPAISKETIDYIKNLNNRVNLVILTLGDPVDQVRKLYKIGIENIKIECVIRKDVFPYSRLMQKYFSDKYCMIGDSIQSDIIPAYHAGIEDVFLGSSKYPITMLPI